MRQASVCSPRITGENALPFNAVLLYQDVATGAKAKHIADFVIGRIGSEQPTNTALWNIASIESGTRRWIAADQAVEADIIIVSMHDGHGMSSSLRMWINQWIVRRKGAHSAMVVLFENPGPATDFARRHLRNAARRAGMDFFTQTGDMPEVEIQPDGLSLAV